VAAEAESYDSRASFLRAKYRYRRSNYRMGWRALEELWLEKLSPFGDHEYNAKPKGTA
jgi:hypothetical protein